MADMRDWVNISGRGLLYGTIQAFVWKDWNTWFKIAVCEPRFEQETSRIESRNNNHIKEDVMSGKCSTHVEMTNAI
jgi:hypothetical protein